MPNDQIWCDMSLFADDSLVYIMGKDINEVYRINADLNQLLDKLNQNKLKFNVKK